MKRGLKTEIGSIAALAGLGLAGTRYKKAAFGLGLLSVGLKLIPDKEVCHFRSSSVVITGGSRGLGLALAEQFLNEGAVVSLLARDSAELEKAKALLKKKTGLEATTYVCDVTHPEELKKTFALVVKEVGDIDILVNNAGSVMAAPLEAMESKDYHTLMDIHFFAAQKACDLMIPYFRSRGQGHIVNISSIGGKMPVPHLAPYCASKFALTGYSNTAAIELARHGIRVTTVHPGLMRTGSPVQGIFKGDSEKEYAWFALSDNLPGLSISVQSAAQTILNAIKYGDNEVVISPPAKLGAFGYALFPEIFMAITSYINKWLPTNTDKRYQTGAESKDWIEKRVKPLKKVREKLQAEYNQDQAHPPEGY